MCAAKQLSVIICTCNRAAALRQTIAALGAVKIPEGWEAELVVVDNGSTDQTPATVRQATLPNMQVVYLREPKSGKANALNAALAHSRGDVIVFIDDDVVPLADWLEQVIQCFDRTQCDALVGNIRLAPHLERPWMGGLAKTFLAIPDFQPDDPLEMVGANCAFRRAVLERVPVFDPELGPGALGLGEDNLFGRQLVAAKFKLEYAEHAVVVHSPDISRLSRAEWLNAARRHGRSRAYLLYHWEHDDIKLPRLKWLWLWLKLQLRRKLQPPPPLESEGCPGWELSYLHRLELFRGFCRERRRPRNYSRHGLVKLPAQAAAPDS